MYALKPGFHSPEALPTRQRGGAGRLSARPVSGTPGSGGAERTPGLPAVPPVDRVGRRSLIRPDRPDRICPAG